MVEVIEVLLHIQIAFFGLFTVLAIIYSIPILFIRRFHNVNNVFTVNFCFAVICCGVHWLCNRIITRFDPQLLSGNINCVVSNYFQMMCTLQVPFAIIGMSVYRLCAVLYHTKIFFRRQRWITLCIVSQWTIGIIVSIPPSFFYNSVSIHSHDKLYEETL